ncbi:MAG: VapE domain-containing protein [Bacteroidota bacterium]
MIKNENRNNVPDGSDLHKPIQADMVSQVENYLTMHYNFRRNAVLGRTDVKRKHNEEWKSLDDRECNSILNEMVKAGIRGTSTLLRTVINSDYVPEFDPFVDYYKALPEWDGVDYIGQLAATVETSNPDLFKTCVQKWLVATVGTHLSGDVVNQTVLVLQGGQGIGKTRWQQLLIPKALEGYVYAGRINPDNKDTLTHLAECGFILMDELAAIVKSNSIEGFKELVTQKIVRLRRPYAEYPENFTRRASFMGTTNSHEFLSDSTGNRRFLVFPVTQINHNHKINMDMVYAQTYHLYKTGERFWLSDYEIKQLAIHNSQFEQKSLEEDLILQELEQCNADDTKDFLTATDVCQYLRDRNHKISLTNATIQRIGAAMMKLGFKRVKREGRNCYAVKLKGWTGTELM